MSQSFTMNTQTNLIRISDLNKQDIFAIWSLVNQKQSHEDLSGLVAWSFEGNGIRTRTTFLEAFRQLNLAYIELPNLLKTNERVTDLAGYLDSYYSLYVIRESNHDRLQAFALASQRPVINAMSQEGHPCEVLTDAYYIQAEIGPLESVTIGLWGPPTNVFRSWHTLAKMFDIKIYHFCDPAFHNDAKHINWRSEAKGAIDVLITDGWAEDYRDPLWSLNQLHLERLSHPKLLPTPPFTIANELSFDPIESSNFVGYAQKTLLLDVQKAIVTYFLNL